MSDSLKFQIFRKIIGEKFCQNLKVFYFPCMTCERQLLDNSGRFLCIGNARPSNFGALSKPRSLSNVFGYLYIFILTTTSFSACL